MDSLEHAEVTPRTKGLDLVSAAFAGAAVEFVNREPANDAIFRNCYWNVQREVYRSGGDIVFGWFIVEIPGIFFICWHHAIWRSPQGNLIDITPSDFDDYSRGLTAFVRDYRQDYNIDWPPAVPQKFVPFICDPRISDFILSYQHWHLIRAEHLKLQRGLPDAKFNPDSGMIEGDVHVQAELRLLENQWGPRIAEADLELQQARRALTELQREVSPEWLARRGD